MDAKNADLMKDVAKNEFSNIQELIKGFDKAIVTHALCEEMGHPNELKMCKMVILYNHQEMSFEEVKRGADDIMKYQHFSLVKSTMFTIIENCVKKLPIHYKARLFKTIFGLTPNDQVHDDRDYFNKFLQSMERGYHGTV